MALTVAPPATSGAPIRRRIGAATKSSTPTRLRLIAVGCAGLTLLAGVVGMVTVSTRHAATVAAWQTAEPLTVDAQAIDTSLADADTTAAGSFLGGQVESGALHARYLADLAQASSTLAGTAQQVGSDPALAASLRTITTGLPTYTGLVATATLEQRQAHYPLAAAYMAEASNLMRTEILPAAAHLYATERARLAADQATAVGSWSVWLTGLLLLALLGSLLVAQRWMSRTFRRRVNVPLAVATLLVLVAGVWFAVAVTAQGVGVDSAGVDGSGPVGTYTQARILALELRADDELTLLSRDSVSSYQADYGTAAAHLVRLLTEPASGVSPSERTGLSTASGAYDGYRLAHDQIRRTDTVGDLVGAVRQASATGPTDLPAVSVRLDQTLAQDIASSQQTFDQGMAGAAGDIGGLVWMVGGLALLAAALIVLGVRPRIGEYR